MDDVQDAAVMWSRLTEAGMAPPIIVKPLVACGIVDAHTMTLLLSTDARADLTYPAIAQQYINHSGILHKVSVIGSQV
jgi:hypothetical protein